MKTQADLIREQEAKDALEHRGVLSDIDAVMVTKSGKNFIKHLFKILRVGEVPESGLLEAFLRDELGTIRAGRIVFELVAEANSQMAGAILGQIEKEKYVQADYDATRQGG